MPTEFSWVVPNRVLYARAYGRTLDIHDLRYSSTTTARLVAGGQPLVHVILDNRDLERVPTSMTGVRDAMRDARHPNLGWSLMMTNPQHRRFANFLVNALAQIFNLRVRLLPDYEAATAYLCEADATLPPRSTWQAPGQRPAL